MKKVLIIDRQAPGVLADELHQLRPWWNITVADDHGVALQRVLADNDVFDLIIINVGRVPCKFDPLALLLVLKLSGRLQQSRCLALLQWPWDERDNSAALAAGAHMVEAYPRRFEHTEYLALKLALRALYEHLRGPQQDMQMFYRFGISALPFED